MSKRARLKKSKANRPAPPEPVPEQEEDATYDLWAHIDDRRTRAAGGTPPARPYPPEARRRDTLASLDSIRWYRNRWTATGLPALQAHALAGRLEEHALSELFRIDNGFYSASSTTGDTHDKEDDE